MTYEFRGAVDIARLIKENPKADFISVQVNRHGNYQGIWQLSLYKATHKELLELENKVGSTGFVSFAPKSHMGFEGTFGDSDVPNGWRASYGYDSAHKERQITVGKLLVEKRREEKRKPKVTVEVFEAL